MNATNHLDPSWLASFVAIAECGSLARAAQRVHRTPSALSVQLRQLESTLSARLVERTTRSLQLTPAGESFLPYASRLLDLQLAAMDAVRPATSQETVRVGLSEYFLPSRLNDLLDLLLRELRGARLEVAWGRSAEMLARWKAGTLDVAVVTSASPPDGAVALLREPLSWVCSPTFHASPERPVPLVLLSDACPVRDQAIAALKRRRRASELRLACSGAQAVVTAVRAGWGVGCLNRSAVPPDLHDLSRHEPSRWPSPGKLAFYSLAAASQRVLTRKLRAWVG
jgi:DNA-binding transcriptional LysR family regulator